MSLTEIISLGREGWRGWGSRGRWKRRKAAKLRKDEVMIT